MAGVADQNPSMTIAEMNKIITEAKRIPVERDSLYNPV